MSGTRRERLVNIAGAATTTVKSGGGTLWRITFNKPVAASTVTIYDNTAGSGTKIGTITNTVDVKPYFLKYGGRFETGLTIVTSGADDITVTFG
jgi:hypothetical protein